MQSNSAEDAAIEKENAAARALQNDSERIILRYKERVKNRNTAIRAKCIECSNGQQSEVRECTVKSCALWPFRMGEDPFNKKTRERMERDADDEQGD